MNLFCIKLDYRGEKNSGKDVLVERNSPLQSLSFTLIPELPAAIVVSTLRTLLGVVDNFRKFHRFYRAKVNEFLSMSVLKP